MEFRTTYARDDLGISWTEISRFICKWNKRILQKHYLRFSSITISWLVWCQHFAWFFMQMFLSVGSISIDWKRWQGFFFVRLGQATLTDVPEGQEPRHWEYYKVRWVEGDFDGRFLFILASSPTFYGSICNWFIRSTLWNIPPFHLYPRHERSTEVNHRIFILSFLFCFLQRFGT